ncbi:MAG: hypothetical protein ACFFBC_12525, partial [Promethearchaeota archaeon]
MSEDSEDNNSLIQNEVIKEEVNLQYHLYILIFGCIFYSSWVIPGICFFVYLLQFFLPNVLETANILLIFTQVKPL